MNILLLLKGGKGSCVAKQKVSEANLPVSFIYVLEDYVVDGYGDGAVNKFMKCKMMLPLRTCVQLLT